MTATAIELKTVNFPCTPWTVAGETLADLCISPVPGTWTPAPEPILKRGFKAILACPNCKHAALITPDLGLVINGVLEMEGFQCVKCRFVCKPRLQHWDRNKLFCVAYEVLDSLTGRPVVDDKGEFVRKKYMHAETRPIAFETFVSVHKVLGKFRVIDVGEVVGFFGLETDKDQKNLTV